MKEKSRDVKRAPTIPGAILRPPRAGVCTAENYARLRPRPRRRSRKNEIPKSHIAGIELLNGFPKLQLRAPEANHNIVESSNYGSCKILVQLLPGGRNKTGCATSRCGRPGTKLGESRITSRLEVFHASTSQKGAFRNEVCGEETKGRAD